MSSRRNALRINLMKKTKKLRCHNHIMSQFYHFQISPFFTEIKKMFVFPRYAIAGPNKISLIWESIHIKIDNGNEINSVLKRSHICERVTWKRRPKCQFRAKYIPIMAFRLISIFFYSLSLGNETFPIPLSLVSYSFILYLCQSTSSIFSSSLGLVGLCNASSFFWDFNFAISLSL